MVRAATSSPQARMRAGRLGRKPSEPYGPRPAPEGANKRVFPSAPGLLSLSNRVRIQPTGDHPIARPPRRTLSPPVKSGPRFDDMIQSDKVRVIDENGENIGVMYTKEAIEQAAGVGLNLVEISPNADPPVAKFLDVGKHRYEAQKKANAARKSQKTQEIKEIKMRPNIDVHDYDVKMRSVRKFLEEGDKVKMTLRFRGREMAHQELGMDLLNRVRDDTAEIAKIEAYPRLEGRQMLMVLAPK